MFCAAESQGLPIVDRRSASRWKWALIAVCVLGAAFRIARWTWGQSFWCDEAFLLLNLREYDLARLLTGRLDAVSSTQAGPPAFLAVAKWLFDAGAGERAMRVPSLLVSLATLPVAAALAWRLFTPAVALATTAMFVVSDKFIQQSSVLKPYSGDVLLATAVLAIAVWPRLCPVRRIIWTATLSVVGMWASLPIIFTFAAVSLGLLLDPVHRRDRRWLMIYVLANAMVAISLLAFYLVVVRVQRDEFLATFWQTKSKGFPPGYSPMTLLLWWIDNTTRIFGYPLRPASIAIALPWFAGVVGLIIQRRFGLLVMLAGPIWLALLAGVLKQYPYQGQRIILFVFPSMFLLCGVGADFLLRRFGSSEGPWKRLAGWSGAAVIAAVVLAATGVDCSRLARPQFDSDLRRAIAHIDQHAGPLPVFVFDVDDSAIWQFYRPGSTLDVRLNQDPKAIIGDPRFWVLTTGEQRAGRPFEPSNDVPLDRQGYTLDGNLSVTYPGGAALMYEKIAGESR